MSNRTKILVIGMDEENPSVIKDCLSDCDVTAIDIDEEKDRLDIPDEERPDLIILNGRSEKERTLELCKGLKTNSTTADIALLAAFDRGQVTQIQYVLEAGANKCALKPFIPSCLKRTVRELLGNR